MKRRFYLDTNVYADAFQAPGSAAARVLASGALGSFEVIASDVLLDELRDVMRRLRGRSAGFEAVRFVMDLPERRVIHQLEWRSGLPTVLPHIRDRSDAPHLAAAHVGRSDAFVTRNRRSVREGIFDLVPLASTEILADALDGNREWPGRDELKREWMNWSRLSPRGPNRRR